MPESPRRADRSWLTERLGEQSWPEESSGGRIPVGKRASDVGYYLFLAMLVLVAFTLGLIAGLILH